MSATKPTLEELRSRVRRLEGGFGDAALRRYVPTGCLALDEALPGGGLPGGALTALVTAARGGEPAWGLAARIAASALRAGSHGVALLIDRAGVLYPPGLAALGAPLERLIFVRPGRARDDVVALEEGLRSPAVAVAIGDVRRPGAAEVRRLVLAVEAGGGIGLLLARPEDEAALSRLPVVLRVRPRAHQAGAGQVVGVEVARCRGSLAVRGQEVLVDVASAPVHGPPRAAD